MIKILPGAGTCSACEETTNHLTFIESYWLCENCYAKIHSAIEKTIERIRRKK